MAGIARPTPKADALAGPIAFCINETQQTYKGTFRGLVSLNLVQDSDDDSTLTDPKIAKELKMQKTYHGGCHCGAVKFEADIDLIAGTTKCNCTWCRKARNWFVLIKPEAFRLEETSKLATYQFGKKTLRHEFCSTCGIHAFGGSNPDIIPADKAWVYVNVATLEDVTEAELANAPIKTVDGLHDAFERELTDCATL